MRYLLDSNILRHYLAQHPVLLANIAKFPKHLVQIPFVVVAEQMRGRYDAILKAESQNLLREQQRLIITQGLLSHFEMAYLDEKSLQEFINLQAKKSYENDMLMRLLRPSQSPITILLSHAMSKISKTCCQPRKFRIG